MNTECDKHSQEQSPKFPAGAVPFAQFQNAPAYLYFEQIVNFNYDFFSAKTKAQIMWLLTSLETL